MKKKTNPQNIRLIRAALTNCFSEAPGLIKRSYICLIVKSAVSVSDESRVEIAAAKMAAINSPDRPTGISDIKK